MRKRNYAIASFLLFFGGALVLLFGASSSHASAYVGGFCMAVTIAVGQETWVDSEVRG